MIKVLTEIKELEFFQEKWNTLYNKAENVTPFQKFEYIKDSLILANKKNELYIIIIIHQQSRKIKAIFPFSLNLKGTISFINFKHSDFCGPLIDPNHNHYDLYKELAVFIFSNPKIKRFELYNLISTNGFSAFLKIFFPYYISFDNNFYSTLKIYRNEKDKSFIDGFRNLNSKRKNYLKNLIKSSPETFKLEIINNNISPYPETEIIRLTDIMIRNEGRSKQYFSSQMLSFWENLYNSGLLHLALVNNEKNIVACHLMFFDEKKNEFIMWILLYEKKEWNTLLYILLGEKLYLSDKNYTINFARGIYAYKIMHFHPDVKQLSCTLIAKTRLGHLKNIIKIIIYYLKPMVKSFLRR